MSDHDPEAEASPPPVKARERRNWPPILTLVRLEDGNFRPEGERDRVLLDEICPEVGGFHEVLDAAEAERICVILRTDLAPEAV